jgi:pyruvate formate lyase activating enzyme
MDDIACSPERGRLLELPTVHKAYLVEKTYGETDVRCGVCAQACRVPEGDKGFCETRVNIERELYTLTYGDVIAAESRPVEIKPFFHFHPGKSMMTIAGPSCNLRCPWCQNHELSRAVPRPLKARHVPMREVVDAAEAAGDIGICVSFTEPLMLFEYCLGLFRESGARGMVNAFVSNGYMTSDALHMLARAGLNAMNVDIKGNERVYRECCGGRAGDLPAWETVRNALKMGVHVEVVHLVVTGLNDREEEFREVCVKHLEYGGPEVPLHITAYRPAFEYDRPATSLRFLEWAYVAAKESGILFPYLGNVREHPYENTFCPGCGELLLERSYFELKRDLTDDGKCPSCGRQIPLVR